MSVFEKVRRVLRNPVDAIGNRIGVGRASREQTQLFCDKLNELIAAAGNETRVINDRFKELLEGHDNQSRLLNDRLSEIIAGSNNQSRIFNDRLNELVAGSCNQSRILNDKLNELIDATRGSTRIVDGKLVESMEGFNTQSRPFDDKSDKPDLLAEHELSMPRPGGNASEGLLTAVLPTHNRHVQCAGQLRFLRDNGFDHPIVVLDSSDSDQAGAVRAACASVADYRYFEPSFRLVDKLVSAVASIDTPFVILIPDDDLIMPHAIEQAIAFLKKNPDYIAAHGYFLSFGMHRNDLEFDEVVGFTPSIDAQDPLARHYQLFRRYQSFYWGVFRTNVFASAVTAAKSMNVVLFRELTVMSTSVLQGKIARLPMIHALRSKVASIAPIYNSDPLSWFLRDAHSFYQNYAVYRNALVQFIRERDIPVPEDAGLDHLLDVVHLTWLGREIDLGKVNYTARHLLGAVDAPIDSPPANLPSNEPADGDVVHVSNPSGRRYIWRKRALGIDRRDGISISPEEINRVERQLDAYHLNGAGSGGG